MRREEARAGVEFGYNDFRPNWRGRLAPSPSRARISISRKGRKLILGLLFVCIGIFLIIVFSVLVHQSGPGAAIPHAWSYTVERGDDLKEEIRDRVDSLIEKIDDFVD